MMIQNFKINWQNPVVYFTLSALLYFTINAITQHLTSSTAVLDQAEQLILSQTWQAGYSEQPPLYTYLTFLLFSIIPPSLAGLFFIKVTLLTLTVFSLLKIGNILNFTKIQINILFFSLPFIPLLVIIPQYDLTHSVLATLFAIITLYIIFKLEQNKNVFLYILLGVTVACGLLSKYNYAVFITALFLTVLIESTYRSIILNKYIIISFLAILLIIIPHFYWVWLHLDMIKEISSGKLHLETETNAIKGLWVALTEAIAYLSPLWLLSFLIIKPKKSLTKNTKIKKFLKILSIIIILLLITFILATGTSYIKARWYQPILFFVILLPALYANTLQKIKYYRGISIFIIIASIIIIPTRIIYAKNFNHFSKPNIPYPSLMQTLAKNNLNIINIIAETQLLAGNARPYFPKTTIVNGKYLLNLSIPSGQTLILCETENCNSQIFQQEALNIYNTDISQLKFNTLTHPYYYSNGSVQKSIYYAVIEH